MFFGLEVKSNQNQAKPITLTKNLRLSQAVLEPTKNGKREPVSLVVEYQGKQFILCVLDPSLSWQSSLETMFEVGSEVKFFVRGAGTVHLTGYEDTDDLDDMSLSMSDEESDEEITSEDEPAQVAEPAKRKLSVGSGKKAVVAKTNGVKSKNGKPNGDAKAKADEDDDDESDDLDFDVDAMDDSEDDDDNDDDLGDEDDDDDDDDSEMMGDGSSDDESDE